MTSNARRTVNEGDYVLATKYRDGDPGDHFAIGFYAGNFDHFDQTRHLVNDADGLPFRANGFRRVARLSRARGAWLVQNIITISLGSHSLWWWYRFPYTKREAP